MKHKWLFKHMGIRPHWAWEARVSYFAMSHEFPFAIIGRASRTIPSNCSDLLRGSMSFCVMDSGSPQGL